MIPHTGVNRLQEKNPAGVERGGWVCKGDGKGAIGPEGKRGRCGSWKQVDSGRAEVGSLATRGQRRGRKGSE